jgi:hypothetical protein
MRFSITSWGVAFSLLAAPALAQMSPPAPAPDTPENCRALPDDGDNATAPGAEANPRQPPDQQLQACRGVLTPPPTGDTDMTAPPPDGGQTPVITPPEVPEQQPSQ